MAMENISVHVRVRPLNKQEQNEVFAWRIENNCICQTHIPDVRDQSNTVYSLDNVFAASIDTGEIYQKTAQPLLKHVLDGINGTILAYGQTSSGKTFTMHGTEENPGLIPRAMEEIFQLMDSRKDRFFCVTVSYMELYNEEVNDLLAPANVKLEIKEHKDKGIFVSGLAVLPVSTAETALQLLKQGEASRHTASTKMNERSSRSHTVFRMDVESRKFDLESPADGRETLIKSTLTLVDLAGSERVSKTGAEGVRMKEGTAINKSLLTLGNVINKLSDPAQAPGGHIPYRDSKLTRILQPSLGGNAKTVMICAITPASIHMEESHQTLRFATRAKRVVNHAHVNEFIPTEIRLRMQERQIQDLQGQLNALKEQKDAGLSSNIEEQITSLMNKLIQSEKDKEYILTTLEQEKVEREKAQLQAEIAKKLLEVQSHTESVSRRRKNRRDTWCPGDFWPKPGAEVDTFHATMGRKRQIEAVVVDPDDPTDLLERVSQRARSMSEGMDSPPGSPHMDEVSSELLPRKALEAQLKETQEELRCLKTFKEGDADLNSQVKDLEAEILQYKERLATETKARQELQVEKQLQQSEMEKLTNKLQDNDGNSVFTFAQTESVSTKLQAALDRALEAEQRAAAAELQCEQLQVKVATTEAQLVEIQAEKEAALKQAAESVAEMEAKHKAKIEQMLDEQASQQKEHHEFVDNLQGNLAALQSENTELARTAAVAIQSAEKVKQELQNLKAQQGASQPSERPAPERPANEDGEALELITAQMERAKQREAQLETKLSEISNQLQMSEGEVRLLVRAKADLEAEARQLRNGTDPFKSRMVDINTFAASKDKDDGKDARKFRQDIAPVKAELQKLQNESKTFKSFQETLQKDLDMTRKKLSETEAKLRQAVQERSEAVQEKASLERKLKLSSQKSQSLGKNLDRKEPLMEKKRDKALDGLKTKAQVDAIEEQLQQTLADLQMAQGDLKATTETAAAAEVKVSKLEQQCQGLQEELAKVTAQCDDLQEKYATASEQLQQEEDAIIALTGAKQEMSSVIVTLTEQMENAQELIQQLQQQKEVAEKEEQRLSEELQRTMQDQSSREDDGAGAEDLQNKLQEARAQLAELRSSLEAAQDKEDEMQTMIEDLQEQVQACQTAIDESNREIERLRKRLEARNADLERAMNTNKEVTGQLEQQVQQRQAAEQELDDLKAQIHKQREAAARSPSRTPPRSAGKSRSLSGLDLPAVEQLQQDLQKQKELTNKLAEEKASEVQTLQTELDNMSLAVRAGQAQIAELKSELQQCKGVLAQSTDNAKPAAYIPVSPARRSRDSLAPGSSTPNTSRKSTDAGATQMLMDTGTRQSPSASPGTSQRMQSPAADYSAVELKAKQLEEQLQQVAQENTILQDKLSQAEQAAAQHDLQIHELQQLVENHPKALQLQQQAIDQLKSELQRVEDAKESLARQLEVLQNEASSLADKASKEQVFYASEMMRVKAELDTVCAERTDLQRQVNRLQEELAQVAEMAEEDEAKYKAEVEELTHQLDEAKGKCESLRRKLDEEHENNSIPTNVFANMEATVQQLLFAASPHSTTESIDMIRSMAMSDFLASAEMQGDQPRSARRNSAGSDSFKDGPSDAGSPLGIKLPPVPELPQFPPAVTDMIAADASARRQTVLPTLYEVPESNLTTPSTTRPSPISPGDVPALDMCMSPCDSEAGMIRSQLTVARHQVQQLAAALRAKVVENADLQQHVSNLQAKAPVVDAETNTVETYNGGRSCLPHINPHRSRASGSPPRTPCDRSKSPARISPSPHVSGAQPADNAHDAKRVLELERKLSQQADLLHGYVNGKAALQLDNQQLAEQVSQLQKKLEELNGQLAASAVKQEQAMSAAESQAMLAVAQSDIEALRTEVDRLQSLNNGLQQQVDQMKAKQPAKRADDWDFMDDDDDDIDFKAVVHSQEAMICNLRRQLAVANSELQRLQQQYESNPGSKPSHSSLTRSPPRAMLASPLKSRNSSPANLTNPTTSPESGFRFSRFSSPLRRPSRENSPARLHIKSPASPRVLQQLTPKAMNFSPQLYLGNDLKNEAKEVMALQAPETLVNAELPAAQRMVGQLMHEPSSQPQCSPHGSGTDAAQVARMAQELIQLKAQVAKLQGELQDKGTQLAHMQTNMQDTMLIKTAVQKQLEHAEGQCKRLQQAIEEERAKLQQEVARLQDELDNEVSSRHQAVHDKEVTNAMLQRQNMALLEAKESLNKKVQDLKSELNTMLQSSVAKCENYQTQLEQVESERSTAVEEVRVLNISNTELKRKLEAAEGHASTHINACRVMEAQHAVYTKQLADLEQQLAKSKEVITDQKDTLRVQQVDIKGYEQEIKHLQVELEKKDQELKHDIDTYEKQVQDLNGQLAAKQAEVKELQQALGQSKEQQERLESEAQLMQNRHFTESKRMQEQSEAVKLEHNEAKRQLDALKVQLAEQNAQVTNLSGTYDKVISERAELEEQLKHALKELSATNEKAQACEKEKNGAAKQLAVVQQELSAVYKHQHMEQSQLQTIQQKCNDLEKQVEELKEEKYHLEVKAKEQERLKRFCIDKTPDVSSLNQELQALKKTVSDFEAAEAEWVQREDMLARQLQQAREAARNGDSQWHSTVVECERLAAELQNVQDECMQKEHQLRCLAREKEEAEAELAAVRKMMMQQRTSDRDTTSRQELEMLQNQLQKARRDLQVGSEQFDKLGRQVDQLERQNQQLVQQKNYAAAALQEAQTEMKHLREQAMKMEQDSKYRQPGLVDTDQLAQAQKREQDLQRRVKELEARVKALTYEVQNLQHDAIETDPRLKTFTREELVHKYIDAKLYIEKLMLVQTRMKRDFAEKGYDVTMFEEQQDMRLLQYERDCSFNQYKAYQVAYKETERRRSVLAEKCEELRDRLAKYKRGSQVKSNVVWADGGDDTMQSAAQAERDRAERGRAGMEHRERSKSRERDRAASAERERARSKERARGINRSPQYARPAR